MRVSALCRVSWFQHTAARRRLVWCAQEKNHGWPSFNTQPPEGGWTARQGFDAAPTAVSTHSRPKAAGNNRNKDSDWSRFQHTAARRRLDPLLDMYHSE